MFTLVARSNCDFIGDIFKELKISLQNLQETVDKISLEQTRMNEKVGQLQHEVKSFRLNMTSRLETLDDLYEASNKTCLEKIRTKKMT